MMKRTKYKKLLAVVPLACMLSAPIIAAPVHANAATLANYDATNQYSKDDFQDWLRKNIEPALVDPVNNISKFAGDITLADTYTNLDSGNLNLTASAVGDGKPGFVSVGTLHNATDVDQVLKTDSKSITNTNSFTETNAEHVGLKIGTETKVSVGIPLLAEGNVTFKMEIDTSYTHTTGNTYTKTTTETFPSQDIKAAPHGTTELMVAVYNQEFSGTYDGYAEVESQIYVADKYHGHPSGPSSLYTFIKEGLAKDPSIKLPSYVKLDDVQQRVFVKVPMSFSGVAGYHTKGEVTFTPDDPKKQVVRMSLEDYKDPVKRAQLLK